MSDVYSLSTMVDIFVLPKQNIDKKAIKLFKLHLLLCVENWATIHHFFFTYHSRKYFIKTFYCLLYTKVPYKSYYQLLLVATYYWLIIPKSTLKSVLLSSKNVAFPNQRHLSFTKAYSKCVLLCWVPIRRVSEQED